METVIIFIVLGLVLVLVVSFFMGVMSEAKISWTYWVSCLCGLLIGILVGTLRKNAQLGLQISAIIIAASVLGITIMRRQRQIFTNFEKQRKNRFKKQ